MSSRCYVVLYTNQKTKKAKTWHDGILKLNENATKATLFDDNNSKLDTLFVRDVTVGEQLESDRYYILVEEEKKTSCSSGNTSCTQRTETISHAVSSKPNFTHHTRGIRTGLKRKTTGFNPPRLVKQLKINDDDASKKEHANCIPEAAVKYQADLSPSGFLGLYSKSSGISSLGKSQEENLYPAKSFICEDIVNKNLLSSQASPWTLIGKRSPTTAELSVHHSSPSINNAPDAICSNKFSCNENVQSNLNACASAEDEESANSSKTSNSMNNGSYEKTKRSAADIIALLRGKKKTQDTTLVKTNSEAVFEEKFKIHNADAITKEQEISYSCSNLPSNLLSKSAVSDIKNLNDSRTLSIVQNDATSLCSSKKEDTQGVISSERISALDADQQIDLKDGSETIENTQPIFDPMSVSNTVTKSPVVGSEASSVNHKVLCVEHEDCDKTETENEDMEENVSFKITYSPLSNASYSDGSDFDDLERVDSFSGTPNENGACSNSSVIPDQSISQSNINSRPNICKKTVCQKYSNHETFSDEATMSLVNSCIHSDTKHDNSSARIINPTSFDIDSSSTKDDDIKAETDVSVFPHSGRTDISVPALERSPVVSSGHDSSIINFKTSSLDAQLKSEHGNYLSMLELSPESLSFNISSQESVTSLEKTVVDKTTLPSIPTKSVKNQRRQNFDDDLQFISTHLNTVPCMFSNNQQSVSSDGKFGLKSCTIDNEVEEDLNGDTLTPDTTCINLKQTCRDSKTPKILDVNEISKIHDASGLECCNAGTTHDFSKTGGSEFVISSEEADILITSGKSSEPASQINQSSVKNEKVILNEHNNTSTYTNKDSSPSDNILVESCETCPGNGQYEIVDRDICSSEDFVGSGDISVSNGENNKMLSLPEEIFPMQCDSFSEEKEFAKSDYSKQKFALSTELLSEVPTSDVSECWNMKQVSFTGFLTDNPKEKSRQISEICDRRCDNLPHPDQLRKKNIMSEMKSKYSTEGTEDLFQSADKLSNYKVKGSITSNVVRRNTHSCQITATSGDDLKNNIIMVQAAKLEQTQAENDNFIFNPEQVQSPAQVVYDQDLTHSEDRPFYLDWNNGKPKFMNDHFELEKIEGSPLQKVPQDIVFDSSDQDFAVAFVPNVNESRELDRQNPVAPYSTPHSVSHSLTKNNAAPHIKHTRSELLSLRQKSRKPIKSKPCDDIVTYTGYNSYHISPVKVPTEVDNQLLSNEGRIRLNMENVSSLKDDDRLIADPVAHYGERRSLDQEHQGTKPIHLKDNVFISTSASDSFNLSFSPPDYGTFIKDQGRCTRNSNIEISKEDLSDREQQVIDLYVDQTLSQSQSCTLQGGNKNLESATDDAAHLKKMNVNCRSYCDSNPNRISSHWERFCPTDSQNSDEEMYSTLDIEPQSFTEFFSKSRGIPHNKPLGIVGREHSFENPHITNATGEIIVSSEHRKSESLKSGRRIFQQSRDGSMMKASDKNMIKNAIGDCDFVNFHPVNENDAFFKQTNVHMNKNANNIGYCSVISDKLSDSNDSVDNVKNIETVGDLVCASTVDERKTDRGRCSNSAVGNFGGAILHGSKRNISGELQFPSEDEVMNNEIPQRQVTIPVTFPNAFAYRQVLTAALKEHLNIQIFELSKMYHTALSKVDTTSYTPLNPGNKGEHKGKTSVASGNPECKCNLSSKMVQVKKEGPNKGRFFYACSAPRNQQCKFFKWADQTEKLKDKTCDGHQASGFKITLSAAESITTYLRGQKLYFYCDCQFIRKIPGFNRFQKSARNTENIKKRLFVKLSKKDAYSLYSKDDLWIISANLSFDKNCTFLAKSVYFGPSTNNEVEIEPISGFSSSDWYHEAGCHAILACNASTELGCIFNLQENITQLQLPILPNLLSRSIEDTCVRRDSRKFVAPARTQDSGNLHVPEFIVNDLCEEYVRIYNLNNDQTVSLRRVANMMNKENLSTDPIVLIHGVFGAGKSYLLAVIIMFLVRIFEENDVHTPGLPFAWKLLISSTTNVAVDRILTCLLDLNFEEFVRVGSVKKIAKLVLPYSVHATGTDNQELQDLQAMLRSDLTPAEKQHVRKSIEKHRLGENKKKLGKVRVVGVTCAASVFSCLHNMKFPIVVIDECSQMTEPASLLPIARFSCRKLVLVGDPKQLDPTIQGSEAAHGQGLEQTMFDRFIKMGYEATMLRTQYRCHPLISAIPNNLFYDGQLINGVSKEDRMPLTDCIPTLCFYDVCRGKEASDGSNSYYNELEAKFVVFLIEALILSGVDPICIGVITLYKSQLFKIITLLHNSKATGNKEMKSIQVSTVDAFQGGEREVIILSCVRTDYVGFIDSDKRTNVALSRAKNHLLIVGNHRNLSKNTLWSKVIRHCRGSANGIKNSDEAMKELEDIFASDNSVSNSLGKTVNNPPKSTSSQQSTDSLPMSLSGTEGYEIQKPANSQNSDLMICDTPPNNNDLCDEIHVSEKNTSKRTRRKIDTSALQITVDDGSSDDGLPEFGM